MGYTWRGRRSCHGSRASRPVAIFWHHGPDGHCACDRICSMLSAVYVPVCGERFDRAHLNEIAGMEKLKWQFHTAIHDDILKVCKINGFYLTVFRYHAWDFLGKQQTPKDYWDFNAISDGILAFVVYSKFEGPMVSEDIKFGRKDRTFRKGEFGNQERQWNPASQSRNQIMRISSCLSVE
ncbi:unnamed protein product [Nesidiocoris tenuis]|uniref:Uncharacterized protein n=1 Tax=Nesidiocoris tenuis TaxID=355587 RepID=A0A6H5G118_9HEMI|nr:unnamed protein product [Nesidiocoris tenuis]